MLEGKCYCCGKGGHRSPECRLKDKIPKEEWAINKAKAKETTKSTKQSLLNTQSNNSKVNNNDSTSSYEGWSAANVQFYQAKEMKNWILLDLGSTVDLFCNPNLVTNICTTTETLEVSTNGGKLFTNQKATVPNYSEVWYNPNAVTNIFCLSEMEKKHRITYNSTKEKALTVHLPNKEVKFKQSSNGIYYHKPRYNTNMSNDKTLVNHTIIPITTTTTNFIHVMIAGVDDNIKIAEEEDNIKIAGVARNTTNTNDANTSK
jgi:hypothetical protein